MLTNFEALSHQEKKDEVIKCSKNAPYFISTYGKIVHPVKGLIPFNLFPFQREIVKEWLENRFTVLRKFRQAGCTTLAAAFALWTALFNRNRTVTILSKGEVEASEFLDRVRTMYDELPESLKAARKLVTSNVHTLKFDSGSTIKSRASSKQAGRSLSASLLIIDEAAFIEHINTIWAAALPTISTGGRVIVLSTVNGIANWFYEIYMGAIQGTNSFKAIDISWKDHPHYNKIKGWEDWYIPNWERTTKGNLRPKEWLQEYEAEFLGTGDTYINGEILKQLDAATEKIKPHYFKYGTRMHVFKEPHPAYEYLFAVDVGLGRGWNNSVFHIINLYDGEQVAEFASNETPIDEFARIIVDEANYYNGAFLAIERNSIGQNLIDWVHKVHFYENILEDEKGDLGFRLVKELRDTMLGEMEESIRTGKIRINSKRLTKELFTFVVDENLKAQAEEGYNDDLVMALSLAAYTFNRIIEKSPINHIHKIDHTLLLPTSSRHVNTDKDDDLSWLMK